MWTIPPKMNDVLHNWSTTQLEDWTVHVHPNFDVVSHDLTPDCACLPTAERVTTSDGGDNWLYIHHSLDGREGGENGDK